MASHRFFATAPKGVEPLLAQELTRLGALAVTPGRGGVAFEGPAAAAYRACLWSRTANRVLLALASFPAADPEALYAGTRAIPWEEHLSPDATLAVDVGIRDSTMTHTRYAAQKVKDAVVDRFRERCGRRPSVDRLRPHLRINAYLLKDRVTISVDLSGESLHRRGYREESVTAPLKENLAAALLLKADWPAVAAAGGVLLDLMCGSGTLPIEAGWLAADVAPGLLRERWGFSGWRQHDGATWEALLAEARQRREAGLGKAPPIVGYDRDARAVRIALANAARAGVNGLVRIECRELDHATPPPGAASGLLVVNPPYGERLGEFQELESLYARLGDLLKERFRGWKAAVFTGNPALGKRMGLRARRVNAFYNGALPCTLLGFSIEPGFFVDREALDARALERALQAAEPFANRLRKNRRILGRWAEHEGVHCYRLYDADIPEYAVAVDLYERWVHVQEYEAPRSVDAERARERLEQVMEALPAVLGMPRESIFLKVRRRQRGLSQYEKHADNGRFFEVREGPARFLVNFTDHLDTGLFLDHRLTRRMIGELAGGRRFLNLFAYTGTATVCAALNGAQSTTSVDLSSTYLDWARRNLSLNRIGGRNHHLVQADCREWLQRDRQRYDLVFLDPPTFSNSKRMRQDLDVQRDHPALIHGAVRLLAAGGVLIFSSNHRRFRLDRAALAGLRVEDITRATIPRDFERNPRIHGCWRITRMGD